MTGPDTELGDATRRRAARLLESVRVVGAGYVELTRRFAGHLGLHPTDTRALQEILVAEDQGEPLTPARLAARIGLSSGATTNLLHRLERAGYVARTRDRVDRRSVTVRSSPGIEAPAEEFFGPFDAALAAVVADHDPAAVEAALAVLDRLNADIAALLGTPSPRSRPYGGDPPES